MHAARVGLAGLFVASMASVAVAEDRWDVGVGAEVHVNPGAPDDGSSTVATGASVQVLRAVGARTSIGVRVDALWLFPQAETHEYAATQQDVVFALRRGTVHPDRATVGFDLGVGVTRYAGSVDIPEMPGCFGCGRYSDVTYRPTVQVGLDVNVPIGGGWALVPRARGILTPVRAEATDVYNFLPGTLGARLDVVVVRRL